MQKQVNQRDARRDLETGGEPSITKKESKRAERQRRRREEDILWNEICHRVEAVTDGLRLPRSVAGDIFASRRADRDLALLKFSVRYRQSTDWLLCGDLSAYFVRGAYNAAEAARRRAMLLRS